MRASPARTSQCADMMRMALGRRRVVVTACMDAARAGCWPSRGIGPPPCVKNRVGIVSFGMLDRWGDNSQESTCR